MIVIYCTCILRGNDFFPLSVVAHLNDADDAEFHSRGDIGSRGPFKGQPYPYGGLSLNGSIERVLSFLENIGPTHDLSIEYSFVYITVSYRNQCNFELSPQELARFSKLGLPLGITCYEDENLVEEEYIENQD